MLMSRNLIAPIHDHAAAHLAKVCASQLSRYKLSMDKPLLSVLLLVSIKAKIRIYLFIKRLKITELFSYKHITYLIYVTNNIVK